MQNFAGGLIVLLFKPYKVGDWIESQGVSGTVKEIQIFHTILTTGDNKVIYIPNGAMSSGVVTNYNTQTTRRVEWIVGVDYGEDYGQTYPERSGSIYRSSCIGCQQCECSSPCMGEQR